MTDNKKPQLRFREFEDSWKEYRFDDIFKERHQISTITDEYPQLSFTIADGVIRPEDRKTNKRDFLIIDKENKKYLVTEFDDIIYNPANVVYGAIHRNKLCKGVVSPIYKIFYSEQDSSFLECIVRNEKFINEISRHLEGTVTKLKTLKPTSFLNMHSYISPSIDEQKKLGEFITNIDKLACAYDNKIQKISLIKKSLLEKMFPTINERIPQLRFNGYTKDWKCCELGEICKCFKDGDWIELKDQSTSGVRLLQTGNVGIAIFIDKEIKKWVSEETFKRLNCTEVCPGDVLISRLPEPAGRACIVPDLKYKMITAVDCTIIKNDKNLSNEFLVQYLSTSIYFSKVNEYLSGGTRQRISRNNLSKFKLLIPEIDEQIEIGNFLSKIDKLILFYNKKVQKLRNIKKSCLNKMFI